MFLDELTLDVQAGNGGHGALSFRREKFVPRGGPDGGDGGRGGDVFIEARTDVMSLSDYRRKRRFVGKSGTSGSSQKCTGSDAEELVLTVPVGTVISDADTGDILTDLDKEGARFRAARGGRGGRGNVHFVSSTRQAPRVRELGETGEHRRLHLELKLIADIGLIGLPNAGKSTLLAALTSAHPKIADYAFTTLSPNLGVAETADGRRVVIADIPGIIEGAHRGIGLGNDFLRHIERTATLIHVIDISHGVDDALRAYEQVCEELKQAGEMLLRKPVIIALNKVDVAGAEETAHRLTRELPQAQSIAAVEGRGCAELLDAAVHMAKEQAQAVPVVASPHTTSTHRLYQHTDDDDEIRMARDGAVFIVQSERIERMVSMSDLDQEEGVLRLQRSLKRRGVDEALKNAGCRSGDTVRIGRIEFTYKEDDL